MLASRGGNPPRLAYGWVYKREFIWDYATHYNVVLDASEDEWLTEQAGTSIIKYDELTEEQKRNVELMESLKGVARYLVRKDLSKRAGIVLEWVQPFANDWPWMLALYNNYNLGERCLEMEDVGGVQRVADTIQQAMTFGDYKPELLWWYDWQYLKVVRTSSR